MAGDFLTWHSHSVDQEQHARQKGQRPCLIWLTGLSGSGKSTIANALELELLKADRHSYLLDGDNVRMGLNKDLGFSDADRVENIRRIAEVSRLMVDAGLIVISAFISPFNAERRLAKSLFPEGQFFEVHVNAPLAVCETRDPKGLYKKVRAGEIRQFTGVDSPYEIPDSPDLVLNTAEHDVQGCVDQLLAFLIAQGVLPAPEGRV
ncbi:adenylyl-sulfate kinase [Simiduia agarivorans]|uniref:Adenylyl-sulfate kinase n=1 Tax=Simiduia agarivorans (strain DSM 21679 / JCM 13881 / BCRC 17597 / SA1) TaxID=1117647 RepID=K4KF98_SIMAS|nr:adenylyl-sulfate kinase [Simiduia agarivorans]AFU97724.1 adenylylsulfate kinase [Simiduia agarivorans SA1 = DSM 21679]